ncbi:MAG: carboxypeptidase-like regulatory domain-containing protein [Pyrinomonadaceae bacterium]|nr:carboxypeptidase regulatory-like domain-containing protein [Acidobacteriota bacterium]
MKVPSICLLLLTFGAFVNAQTAVLTGTVYDAYGALITKAKISATNSRGQTFESITDDNGVYVLNLKYSKYDPKQKKWYRIMQYDITVDNALMGFKKFELKGFNFVPSANGKMILDFALEGRDEISIQPI